MKRTLTRDRLLDAAHQLLSEGRMADLSIDNITENAGLSRRTFFLHFRSKDDLLCDLLEHTRQGSLSTLASLTGLAECEVSPEDRIHAFFREVVDRIQDPRWQGCLYLRLAAEYAELRGHPLHEKVRDALQDTEAWFRRQLSGGGFPMPSQVAQQLMVLLYGLLIMQLVSRKPAYGISVLGLLRDLLHPNYDFAQCTHEYRDSLASARP